jgi:hypothetical protein
LYFGRIKRLSIEIEIFIMVKSNSPNQDNTLRLVTLRWIEDQCKIVVDLITTQKDLSDEETDSLRRQYKELNLRMRRERRELKRFGLTD